MSGALIVYALVSLMVLLISLMVLDAPRRARERRNGHSLRRRLPVDLGGDS